MSGRQIKGRFQIALAEIRKLVIRGRFCVWKKVEGHLEAAKMTQTLNKGAKTEGESEREKRGKERERCLDH